MNDVSAEEMALHIAMCVCADYVKNWGLGALLDKLEEYSDDPVLPSAVMHVKELEGLIE